MINIKLDQAEFIDKGPLSGDSKFDSIDREIRKSCLGWLFG